MYVEDTEPPPPRMKNLTEVMSAVTRLKCTCSVQASITDFMLYNYLYCTQYTVKIHLPSLLIEMIQSSNP